MAKVKNPLFSIGASGTVAGLLTINQSATAPTVRRKPSGYAPPTVPQAFCRARCAAAAAHWRSLPQIEKDEWAAVAALTSKNVFAKYLLEWSAQASDPLNPPHIPMR